LIKQLNLTIFRKESKAYLGLWRSYFTARFVKDCSNSIFWYLYSFFWWNYL